MKKSICALCALFGIFAVPVDAASMDRNDEVYAQLIAQAESGVTSVDYTALRQAYAQSSGYDGYGTRISELFDELYPALKKMDCSKVITASDQMLKINYTISTPHKFRSVCFASLGDVTRAQREDNIASGLLTSLISSGDGKSAETAFIVVTMNEERLLLAWKHVIESQQSLIMNNGHTYDLISGKNSNTGENESIWFQIDAIFHGFGKEFEQIK